MNLGILPGATPCVTPNLQRFLSRLDRPELEAVAQAAIDRLDDIDGDPDLEDGDDDRCTADDDCGGDSTWVGRGDDLVGDPEDAENDDAGICAHFGINQALAVGADRAFIDLNAMSAAEVDAATIPLFRRRLDGKRLGAVEAKL